MVMTGYIHWAGCMWYLLSELVIRFNIIDGDPTIEVAPNILCSVGGQSIVLRFSNFMQDVTWRDCPSCTWVDDVGFLYVFYWAANTLTSTG